MCRGSSASLGSKPTTTRGTPGLAFKTREPRKPASIGYGLQGTSCSQSTTHGSTVHGPLLTVLQSLVSQSLSPRSRHKAVNPHPSHAHRNPLKSPTQTHSPDLQKITWFRRKLPIGQKIAPPWGNRAMHKVKNITVCVAPEIYRQARHLAAEYDSTVSAIVAWLLQRLPAALERSRFPKGGPKPSAPPAQPRPRPPLIYRPRPPPPPHQKKSRFPAVRL